MSYFAERSAYKQRGVLMSEEKSLKVSLILRWVTAALILGLGVLLIISCVSIYVSGDRPFSREIIAAKFDSIAWLVYLFIAVIVAAAVFPGNKPRAKAVRDDAETLKRLRAKVGGSSTREQSLRTIYYCVCAAIICCIAIYPVCYFLNPANFTITNLNSDVIKAAVIALSAAVLSLIAVYISSSLASASICREIAILKKLPEQECVTTVRKSPKNAIRIGILLLAIVFIVMGIFNEGVADVLGKAIRICTECIGLG